MKKLTVAFLAVCTALMCAGCTSRQAEKFVADALAMVLPDTEAAPSSEEISQQTAGLEMPASRRGELLLHKSQMTISFNTKTLCPDYVCWVLTTERADGLVKRNGRKFHEDEDLEEPYQVAHADYSGSGFDRGHMCPAADNKNSERAMDESFCMSNVCPQHPDLNQRAWNELEDACRSWARNYGPVYICCGPIFNADVSPQHIRLRRQRGNNARRIGIPDAFFKVVLMLGREPKAIGFVYPNEACEDEPRAYALSVDDVERVTGLDFFHQLDDTLEERIEAECRPGAWGL